MSTTISTSFTATGVGQALAVKFQDSITFSVSGTFVGTVVLEKSGTAGISWTTQATFTATQAATQMLNYNSHSGQAQYRFRCSAYTSGTIVTSIADFDSDIVRIQNNDGVEVFAVTEGGVRQSSIVSSPRNNVASTATIAALAPTSSYVKLTGSTATDLQGIAAGIDGQQLVIVNLTGQTLTIRSQSASAASGNKIRTLTGSDITTTGNGAAGFIYDTDASPAEWTNIWNTA